MFDLINPLKIRRYEKAEHPICFCSSILSLGIRANSNGAKSEKRGFRAQAKTLMLKQQKAEPSDLSKFRDEPMPDSMGRIILEADVWGDDLGYQILIDADNTAYDNGIPTPTLLVTVK